MGLDSNDIIYSRLDDMTKNTIFTETLTQENQNPIGKIFTQRCCTDKKKTTNLSLSYKIDCMHDLLILSLALCIDIFLNFLCTCVCEKHSKGLCVL